MSNDNTSPNADNVQQENESQTDSQAAKIPPAGLVYGETVYWGTIAATVMVFIGQIVTFVTKANYAAPGKLLTGVWKGNRSIEQIWQDAAASVPEGHWYLAHLATGDGFTAAGIALGVAVVVPAILGASFVLFRQGERLYGALAFIAAVITISTIIP